MATLIGRIYSATDGVPTLSRLLPAIILKTLVLHIVCHRFINTLRPIKKPQFRRQAFIGTSDGLIFWRIYVSLGLNEFVPCPSYPEYIMMTSSNSKHFPRYWPFVMGTHRSSVDSPYKGSDAELLFSLICAWTNGWANNRDADDLRRHGSHHDVTLMMSWFSKCRTWGFCSLYQLYPIPVFCIGLVLLVTMKRSRGGRTVSNGKS